MKICEKTIPKIDYRQTLRMFTLAVSRSHFWAWIVFVRTKIKSHNYSLFIIRRNMTFVFFGAQEGNV